MAGGSVCVMELGYFRVPLTLSSTSTTLVVTPGNAWHSIQIRNPEAGLKLDLDIRDGPRMTRTIVPEVAWRQDNRPLLRTSTE